MTGAQIAAAARRQNTVIPRRTTGETTRSAGFVLLMYTAVGVAFLGLGAIIWDFASDGVPVLSWDFLTSFPSRVIPASSGIQSAIVGTIYLMIICAVLVIPLGVMTAVYLEEYADGKHWFNRLIEVNIQNLAGVPSVVYGILGLAFIVRGPLSLGPVLLAGGITLALLVLPGRDHRGAGGDPGRAAVDPRGLAGARRDAVADDLEAGAAGLDRRHRHRRHPRARRARSARRRRCWWWAPESRYGSTPRASTARSRRCRSRSSPGRRTPTRSSSRVPQAPSAC